MIKDYKQETNLERLEKLQKEFDELEEKKRKLKDFLWKDTLQVSDYHYQLLTIQYYTMCNYSEVLDLRIKDLKH